MVAALGPAILGREVAIARGAGDFVAAAVAIAALVGEAAGVVVLAQPTAKAAVSMKRIIVRTILCR